MPTAVAVTSADMALPPQDERTLPAVVLRDLDRQPLGGEQEFDHQRRRIAVGMREPYLTDAPFAEVAECRGYVGPSPRLFYDMRGKAGQHDDVMCRVREDVKRPRASSGAIEPVRGAPARLVEPETARVIDNLVRPFFERDRFEQVVIDEVRLVREDAAPGDVELVAIDQVRTVEDHLATATRPADGTETHLLTCEGMARWADGFQRPVRLVLTIDSDNQTWIDEAWDESPTGSA